MHEKNTTIQWRAATSETSHAIGTPKPGRQIGYIHDQFKVISKNKKQNKKKITPNQSPISYFSS